MKFWGMRKNGFLQNGYQVLPLRTLRTGWVATGASYIMLLNRFTVQYVVEPHP